MGRDRTLRSLASGTGLLVHELRRRAVARRARRPDEPGGAPPRRSPRLLRPDLGDLPDEAPPAGREPARRRHPRARRRPGRRLPRHAGRPLRARPRRAPGGARGRRAEDAGPRREVLHRLEGGEGRRARGPRHAGRRSEPRGASARSPSGSGG
ncbi:MAG: hypothetical protein M0C28_16035 [Candidatus Moduliflexus flocculans]|nr:hypothetical protein [Candidatus Moduliflexus flocculans]